MKPEHERSGGFIAPGFSHISTEIIHNENCSRTSFPSVSDLCDSNVHRACQDISIVQHVIHAASHAMQKKNTGAMHTLGTITESQRNIVSCSYTYVSQLLLTDFKIMQL